MQENRQRRRVGRHHDDLSNAAIQRLGALVGAFLNYT